MSPPATPSVVPRRRRWFHAVLVLALCGLAAGGGAFRLRQARADRVRAALPAVATPAANAMLRALLSQAQADAAAGSLPAVAELGRLCHANGLRREAEACWRLLIREQPGEPRWHYYLADLLRTAGDHPAAEAELEATVAADPAAATAWLQLAEMQFKSGRPEGAATGYMRRLELLPDDPYAELGLARVAQLQGRTDETRWRLERILRLHPQFSAAHNLYAELQAAAGREDLADHHRWLGREAGRFREADDPWMDELHARCHEPKRLCHLGVIAYQTKRGDLGRASFERAIALAPGDPLAYQLLGDLLLQQGAAGEARDLLARGIALAQTVAPTPAHYLKLSEAGQKLGRGDEARQVLRDGLVRHPDSAELHHGLGNLHRAEGNAAEALAAYRRALELDPSFVEADFALALTLLESGGTEEAVQALQHALTMQPTFPKALLLLARLEMEAGRTEDAGRHLLPLLKANPGSPEIRRIVARWRLQTGRALEKADPAAAERHYRDGLKLQPDDPELNASLGVFLLVADRASEAVPALEAYHRLQPASPQAALFLGQAYARSGRLAEARRVLTAGLQQAEQAGQSPTVRHFREILSMLPP